MKITIGVLLIVCAISNSMAVRLTKDQTKRGLLAVNALRAKHADAYEILNMNTLKYDRELEEIAVNRGCEHMNMIGDDMTFSIVPIPPIDQWTSMNTLEKEAENFGGLLEPYSETIGCSFMKGCHVEGKTYDFVCLVQPLNGQSGMRKSSDSLDKTADRLEGKAGQKEEATTGAESQQWSLACMILTIFYSMF